jgi:hypothetical protein
MNKFVFNNLMMGFENIIGEKFPILLLKYDSAFLPAHRSFDTR